MLDWALDSGEEHTSEFFQRDLAVDAETTIKRLFKTLNTAIVVKSGRIVFAKVYDQRVAFDTPAPVYSVTKSVVSLLIGGAIERGELGSVEQPIETLLDASLLQGISTDVKSITLHQLLSMTTGFKWPGARQGLEPMMKRIWKNNSWIRATLEMPVIKAESGQFNYNTAVSHLLSAVLTEATGQTVEQLAASRLFEPMDIKHYQWELDPEGYSTGGWGLSLSPIDMAKLGVLCLARGRWNDQQLIQAEWITQMWRAHSTNYGYQWWRRSTSNLIIYTAQGLGGQFICCVPEHDIVIVLTSDFAGRKRDLWPILEKYWLPAAI